MVQESGDPPVEGTVVYPIILQGFGIHPNGGVLARFLNHHHRCFFTAALPCCPKLPNPPPVAPWLSPDLPLLPEKVERWVFCEYFGVDKGGVKMRWKILVYNYDIHNILT